jgi:predicted ferric reductase
VSAAPSTYVWWLAGRSAGIVALLLVLASVLLGLAMAARLIPATRRRDAVRVHEHLALMALAAIAAHGALLAADPWLKAGWKGVAVPFAIGYRPLWTGLGVIGGYLATIFALSFYLRRRIGVRVWRRLHRLMVAVYVLSLAHALGSGTDASIAPVRYAMLASVVPVALLFALRLRPRSGAAQTRGAGARTARPAAVPAPATGDTDRLTAPSPANDPRPAAPSLSAIPRTL